MSLKGIFKDALDSERQPIPQAGDVETFNQKLVKAFIAAANEMQKSVEKTNQSVTEIYKSLNSIKTFEGFREISVDKDYLHRRLRLTIEKIAVVTEVAFLGRQYKEQNPEVSVGLNSAAIWALDQPDEWWDAIDLIDKPLKEVAVQIATEHAKATKK